MNTLARPLPADSVGIVKPELYRFDKPLDLRSGKRLPSYELMVETYGELNPQRSNAVLICHALSGDHHAAGYHSPDDAKPGWWEHCIGPGKPIDTRRFFVVCLNNLGGCGGSSGPASINPANGEYYGPDFPLVTVRDWVNSQLRLMQRLNIRRWAAVVGGSLGGMQVLRWAISYPQRLRHAVAIAAAPKLSAQNIAFNEVARQSISKDPDFHGGRYLARGTAPKQGLMLARMLGHITYLSDDAMRAKFGRMAHDLQRGSLSFGFDTDFQVESYLHHQGERFSENFDANTYLLMTKALDYFDPAVDYGGDLSKAFATDSNESSVEGSAEDSAEGSAKGFAKDGCGFFLVSFSSDWRFPPVRSREILRDLLKAGRRVSYVEIESDLGHDSFLLPVPRYLQSFAAYMDYVFDEVCGDGH